MVSNTELNDNYKAISQLPIVKQTLKCVSRLTKENKALVKENAMLKKMIDRLFDRQSVSTKTCCCGCSNANRPIPDIQIKKEKVVIDMTHDTTSSQTDENIVYELSEDADNNLDNKPIPYIIEEEYNNLGGSGMINCCTYINIAIGKTKLFSVYYGLIEGQGGYNPAFLGIFESLEVAKAELECLGQFI